MANALVSMVVNKLREEVYLVGDAKEEVEKLSSTLESIKALLNDAEIMQFHNESMQVWLKKLKDVVYDVEDVVDEMIPFPESESGTHNGDDRLMGNQPWACLFSLLSCCGLEDWIRLAHESMSDGDDIRDKVRTFVSKVASQRDFARKIKQVRAKLDQIAADTNKFSFQLNHSSRGDSEHEKAVSQTSSLVDESQIHGRDKDRDTIISKLISGSSCEEGRIRVISIVGVGGLGKTTLAQLICNDERVTSHFPKQVLWVCVSDDFNVINLTKAIIEAAGGTSPTDSQLNLFQMRLRETLQDKLFLLVLDDVWNDDSEKWERLWLSLQTGAPGSKILVTTRSEKVAITCRDSAYMHKLEGLSDDDCWLLFSSRAFTGRKSEDCLALEKIGREIVKKCKGVPLSATVMGSAMRSKTTTQDWQNILESQTWEIPDIANGIFPALLLSYYNLPRHLKPCFAYCSLFPKDHEMEKDRLVQLWLAQGFIKPQGRREMEAIGGEYFDDLLRRSLLQYYAYVDYKRATVYKMHDLLHDLIQFITKNECCIFENGNTDTSSVLTVRHSSFIPTRETSHIPAPLCHAKKLRTLLQTGGSTIFGTIPDNLFQCARSLRALDFGGTIGVVGRNITELPSSIGLLKHLRYLDLSKSGIVELPESVTHLRNLQTLKLNSCWQLARLPRGMGKLVSLRHLEIYNTWKIKYLPEGLGRISSLRTLSRFIVGGDGGCKIGELKRLDSLQGKLQIEHLERVTSVDDAKEAQLENKLQLRVLFLQSRDDARILFRQSRDNALKICESDEVLPDDEVSGDDEVERMDNVLEALSDDDDEVLPDDEVERMDNVLEALPDDNDEVLPDDEVSGDDEVERMDNVLEALPDDDDKVLPDDEVSGDNEVERMDDVLEALRPPHANLEKLVIERCIGSKFPTWMEDLPFSNLVDLRLIGCNKCTQLPGLGRLPSLKYLEIARGLVKRVGSEFYGNSSGGAINRVAFPKLEELEFMGMDEFEEWELRLENREIMPSLQSLTIIGCPKLKILLTHLPKSLTSLSICGCYEISADTPPENFTVGGIGEILWPLLNLPSLKTFQIYSLENTTCFPNGWKQGESLETLYISNCPKLRSLPDDLGQLKSLRDLVISDCPELLSLPQRLQGLTRLVIRDCSKLRSLPDDLGQLKSLETLDISNCSKLRSLPDDLGQLKSLESLTISNCSKLRSLTDDLGHLESLRSLKIEDCPRLQSLSQGLQGLISLRILHSSGILSRPLPKLPSLKTFYISNLDNMTWHPDGWEQLESLESLDISNCSKLRSLPDDLGQLRSLRSLVIFSCPELLSLPQGLQGLTCLVISNSPMLAERCRGEDWSNISHIPDIDID